MLLISNLSKGYDEKIHLYYIDYIVIILYGYLVAVDILAGTRMNYKMSFDTGRTIAEGCLLVAGLIKVFIYFDQDRRKAIFAMAFLVSAIILKNAVHIDYWNIVVVVFATFNSDFELIAKTHISVVISVLSVAFVSAYTGLSNETYEDVGNVRVTFDMNITSSTQVRDFLTRNYRQRPILGKGGCILEVKWDEILPTHIKEVLDVGDLQWGSFSKYASCVEYSI